MRFRIKHEMRNRVRIHILQKRMTCREADLLQYFLEQQPQVTKAVVYEQTCDAVICYAGSRRKLLEAVHAFRYSDCRLPDHLRENSSRPMVAEYKEKLIGRSVLHYGIRLFLPKPLRAVITVVKAVPYLWKGIRTLAARKLEVPVLDATAIAVSLVRKEFDTAGSVIFLLGVGELLEEWTHKKSVDNLARSMSVRGEKVWMLLDGQEVLVRSDRIRPGDQVVVHMGNVIPFDGTVAAGRGSVNQSGMTGESLPVRKEGGDSVFAGTVLEDGELTILVRETSGSSRYEKIVKMIEDSEKLKSSLESKAEHLADRLVPWSFAGSLLTWLLSGSAIRAISVLMVDYSCALKLAMPVSVLAAIREAGEQQITVKGGRFLEQMAAADTIVFDKTGTLTKARPRVVDVVPFGSCEPDELLRIAACLEEHFPHSMAKAVTEAAMERGLEHEEMHTKVEYIVAHGIATTIEGKQARIGSAHFIFEDEGCTVPEGMEERFRNLPKEYSHLYLAIDGQLAGVICIADPLRPEAAEAVARLRQAGFRKIVMMTGDNRHTAAKISDEVGVDEYHAEVLPEDKASFINEERAAGRTVVMVGDGINDSPALSAADVGIAISDGAEIAREIADITVSADDLNSLVALKAISTGLMQRIRFNYRFIVSFNSALIALGVLGILPPATSALLHNASTLAIGLRSLSNVWDGQLPE